MTLDDTIEIVKDEVRNYFNDRNSPNCPPVITSKYLRFLKLCEEIHAFVESPSGAPSVYVSESVLNGKHAYTKATGQDGTPVSWQQVFAVRLHPYRRMFVGERI